MKPVTRRRFISSSQTTATIAAGSAVLGFPRLARSQSSGDQIVLALIGAGGRAANHAAACPSCRGVEFN